MIGQLFHNYFFYLNLLTTPTSQNPFLLFKCAQPCSLSYLQSLQFAPQTAPLTKGRLDDVGQLFHNYFLYLNLYITHLSNVFIFSSVHNLSLAHHPEVMSPRGSHFRPRVTLAESISSRLPLIREPFFLFAPDENFATLNFAQTLCRFAYAKSCTAGVASRCRFTATTPVRACKPRKPLLARNLSFLRSGDFIGVPAKLRSDFVG